MSRSEILLSSLSLASDLAKTNTDPDVRLKFRGNRWLFLFLQRGKRQKSVVLNLNKWHSLWKTNILNEAVFSINFNDSDRRNYGKCDTNA